MIRLPCFNAFLLSKTSDNKHHSHLFFLSKCEVLPELSLLACCDESDFQECQMEGLKYHLPRADFMEIEWRNVACAWRVRSSNRYQALSEVYITALSPTSPILLCPYPNTKLSSLCLVLTGGSPEESCKKAEHVLKTIQGWSDDEVPNKNELIGNLYSCIGNAQLEMGQMEAALQSHKMDLEFARQK